MTVNGLVLLLDRLDHMGRGAQSFIGDGGKKRRQIDRPYRLGAENERIIMYAFLVNLRLERERADAVEASLRR